MTSPYRALLMCSDLDRTLIPNGHPPEPRGARPAFRRFVSRPGVELVYVSGRGLTHVREAIAQFDLPAPAYAITDVGTAIYRITPTGSHETVEWTRAIAAAWGDTSRGDVEAALQVIDGLKPQPPEHQRPHKCSFFAPVDFDMRATRRAVAAALVPLAIESRCICSVDPMSRRGLVDVLPASASKLHALRFLQRERGYDDATTVFAGDSGNDLEVLASSIPSVLVGNAEPAVREEARRLAVAAGHADQLYFARENYAAGVIEGVAWFGHVAPGRNTGEQAS